jgi:hypothetical protein
MRSKRGIVARSAARCCRSARCYLKRVKRARIAFGLCLTAASLLGCGQGSLSAPKPAPEAVVENRAMPLKQPRALPPLIAPPPKYGNKIVMAQASGRRWQ